MNMEPGAERTTIEIKNLLRNLDPQKSTGHKDRKARLKHFRFYMSGESSGNSERITTPEYYDDDLPMLFLGSDDNPKMYGLLSACGTPSTEHDHMLKRSARTAMSVLKFLVLEFRDMVDGRPLNPEGEMNSFAIALCSCTKEQLKPMNLELHVSSVEEADSKRGGARDDACEIIFLLGTKHLDPFGEKPDPLLLEDLLPSSTARKAFWDWLKGRPNETEFRDAQNAAKNKPTIEDLAQTEEKDKKVDEPRNEMGIKINMGDDAPRVWTESELSA
eukprot:CAMPEP_0172505106 /NCGR_PEP_ID=MMETSP1066-20121228/183760_1 /TAXON_ID=671091 /ORGANISM="Coscinodiscus wailesii, Strain CCMP2513" /LENGTH=273 /DNA_ID=CAMNT_0013281583 /DNA_START=153 /DNA_END=971 /DNA_ORIENTATION=-